MPLPKVSTVARVKKWEELTGQAMATLADAMTRGTIAERTIAAKIVIERAIPIVKHATVGETARAAALSGEAGGGGGHLAALLATARARLAAPDTAPDTAPVFAPSARVETNEVDMQLDTVNMLDEVD